jgi:D-glycero-alpha-D-manno-heptose-7-phosphate kinase
MEAITGLHKIKQIGIDGRNALEDGDLKRFGRLLDIHWKTKKTMTPDTTTPGIDEIYKLAVENGATGGKIMGAGGGGFFMFNCDSDRLKLTDVLEEHGLRRLTYRLEFGGSRTVINL